MRGRRQEIPSTLASACMVAWVGGGEREIERTGYRGDSGEREGKLMTTMVRMIAKYKLMMMMTGLKVVKAIKVVKVMMVATENWHWEPSYLLRWVTTMTQPSPLRLWFQ